ncbi:MAG: vWA domain-containing protein [Desulfomonilaceae bacterium]|nr:vWA domain-containing protein [Desulfomonilaceae bacterium]
MDCGIGPIKIRSSSRGQTADSAAGGANRDRGPEPAFCEEAVVDGEGLSTYWRMNTSPVASTELANLLRALRKAAGYLGPNVGRIEWAGMSQGDAGAIVLDPSFVLGRYPIPGEKVDRVIGVLVHEAVSRIEWSDLVWRKLEPYLEGMKILHNVKFQKIVEKGEQIYCDMVLDRCMLGLYAARARRAAMSKARLRLPPNKATLDELLHLWWESTWGEEDTPAGVRYDGTLESLRELTRRLKETSESSVRVDRRCEQRKSLYIEAWENTKEAVVPLDVVDKVLVWHPEPRSTESGPRRSTRTCRSGTELTSPMAGRVEMELAAHSTDLTPIIRSVAGYDNEDVVPMSRWDFTIAARPVVDGRQVTRLRALFRTYAERSKLVSRGLISGKIDQKRLYRAPISGRCFMEAHTIPNMNWNICLLVDASGSMRGGKWRLVENSVATIHKAFLGFENSFRAWAYFEANGISMLSNLVQGKNLLSIPPAGQTTSGQSIIAAAYFMPQDSRRRLLIHITDGESNLGCRVQYGIDFCRERGIHLVTLGCGHTDRKALQEQYGRSIEFLNSFSRLPSVLEKLLKWTLVYGRADNHSSSRHSRALSPFDGRGGAM